MLELTSSAEETRAVGEAFAQKLRPGDVVLLSGDLGAGKTQFAQGVAAGLGVAEVPISPTFNIVITYGSGRMPLHHFDLYRLDSPAQLEDIGLAEYLESGGVCLVEWAEKFPNAFEASYRVSIQKVSESERRVNVEAVAGEAGADAGEAEADAANAGADAAGAAGDALKSDVEGRCDAHRSGSSEGHRSEHREGCRDESRDGLCEGRLAAGLPDEGGDLRFVVAVDTANEVVALGVGELDESRKRVCLVATREVAAHRASNTTLVPALAQLLDEVGITRQHIACVCVGRGPGSFTGVRICMAAAKGIAQALGVGLVGVSTLDAIAWNAQAHGVRGNVLVVADAMRKEVYPVRFALDNGGIRRLSADRVVKAQDFAEELGRERAGSSEGGALQVIGDALVKYRDLFEPVGAILPDKLWEVSGCGLLLAFEAAWQAGQADPLDARRHDPAFALPVYTRLSDAEENERVKLARTDEKNLKTGVQDVAPVAPDGGKGRATMHSQAHLVAPAADDGVSYHPLDAKRASEVTQLCCDAGVAPADVRMPAADELGQRNLTWWVAERDQAVVGCAGALVADGDAQVQGILVHPAWRRRGIGRELLLRVAEDARNLGASSCSVHVEEEGALQAFCASLGLAPADASQLDGRGNACAPLVMHGQLPERHAGVAGMELQHLDAVGSRRACSPLILAIESSCDETAAAVVNGEGMLLSDVVASQIDFHARFGGVVPEIASRKHIEAICGVCAEALECAGVTWRELDSVAVTYAPGLLGALVVGVAFAKGVAWALDVPFIGVNHLEGHLYANKIGDPGFEPPAVVSLVSGGNTMLVHMRGWGDYEVLGETIDDAVGEAFDKVAKALGLGYPGGPVISQQAALGNADAIAFPRAMLHSHDLRFSLSGLKTAVVNYINGERSGGRELNIPNVAASFQQAVIDVQVAKARTALEQTGAPTFCLGGGVAANPALREAYERLCAKMGVRLVMPPLSSCGDNAGMIALVALDRHRAGKFFPLDADAQAHANLAEPY